tara:strand:- start:305 stop:940 length:636 start_codon:yes stop_codon:yes gene_type:complete
MKLTRAALEELVKEELKTALEKRKTARDRARQDDLNKRRRSMLGGDTMVRLASGIVSEEDEDESKRSGKFKDCKGRGNDAHDSQGRFSSKRDASSHSLYFSCPEYPYRVRSGMRSISDPKDAGRGKDKNKGKGRYRVKDNTPLWEDDQGELAEDLEGNDGLYLRHIVRQELERLAIQLNRGKKGGCSWDDVLTVMRQWKAAEQYKPPKPKA